MAWNWPAVKSDRPAGDIGITAGLVGVRMVAIVLGDPPAVAEPDQQLAVDPADQVVNAPGARDLAMAGVVTKETCLGEHDPKEDGDEHLPPRLPEQANAVHPQASRSSFTAILTL